MGPKWPFTLPNSSSNTKWKKRASNLPCLVEVVVTSIASWPPPSTTWSKIGLSAAELTGRSVLYSFKSSKELVSNSLAVWSLEAVMNMVPSRDNCMSLIWWVPLNNVACFMAGDNSLIKSAPNHGRDLRVSDLPLEDRRLGGDGLVNSSCVNNKHLKYVVNNEL
ncbi:hypothetical protein MSG28_003722 [Choristoneura fumiferana]|uniref:Uncharacterized protein n=2 Tax=Choristoneura fumiferana TaxID=7141 RepID=A0ACC0KFZ2_CHOFU|nr:hypothetical protein MSG28_003722 [Choristoneura fumiferana]KAI8435410.1 hypothetical protein MSG28_003722 [Choristoneura fumiferana]